MWSFDSYIEDFANSNSLWGHHFVVPDDTVQAIKEKGVKRLICSINKVVEYNCSLLSDGNGTYYINCNKENRKALGATTGSKIQIMLTEDTSKYGMPVPEEMEEILSQDEEANRVFHLLTPGKQRSLLYQIGKPKGTESRIKKAIGITRYLKSTGGKLDFKELNEFIKNTNNLY